MDHQQAQIATLMKTKWNDALFRSWHPVFTHQYSALLYKTIHALPVIYSWLQGSIYSIA